MIDGLERVIDVAKKLRKFAKKVDNQDVQGLIVDLNLCVADLKLQLVEQQEEALRLQRAASSSEQSPAPAPQGGSQPDQETSGHPLSPTFAHG